MFCKACNFIKKETLAQVLILQTPLVAASNCSEERTLAPIIQIEFYQ